MYYYCLFSLPSYLWDGHEPSNEPKFLMYFGLICGFWTKIYGRSFGMNFSWTFKLFEEIYGGLWQFVSGYISGKILPTQSKCLLSIKATSRQNSLALETPLKVWQSLAGTIGCQEKNYILLYGIRVHHNSAPIPLFSICSKTERQGIC